MKGLELKKLRESADLTQQELADMIKVTRKTINTYENSDNIPPSKEQLFRVILKQNVTSDQLNVKTVAYKSDLPAFPLDEDVLRDKEKLGALIKFLAMYHHELKKDKAYQLHIGRIEEEYDNRKKIEKLQRMLSSKEKS